MAGLFIKNCCLSRERTSAAAGTFSGGVVEHEPTGVQAILEIYFHTHYIHAVFFIHNHLYTANIISFVVIFLFVEAQQVRHTRAATTLHPNP